MKLYLSFILTLVFGEIVSQIPITNPFKSQKETESKVIFYDFQVMLEKLNDSLYIQKEFNASSKQLTTYTTFKTIKPIVKHGLHYEKWDDGEIFFKGEYVDNQKNGFWIEMNEEGIYDKGIRIGEWKSKAENDASIRIVNYVNGKIHGEVKNFDSVGNVVQMATYVNDSLVTGEDGKMYDEPPVFFNCIRLTSIEERRLCSNKNLLDFFNEKVKFPKSARNMGIKGTAVIWLVVSKEGDTKNFIIKRALCEEIKTSLEKVMASMPIWTPGIQKGKNVNVKFSIPLKFKL